MFQQAKNVMIHWLIEPTSFGYLRELKVTFVNLKDFEQNLNSSNGKTIVGYSIIKSDDCNIHTGSIYYLKWYDINHSRELSKKTMPEIPCCTILTSKVLTKWHSDNV